MKGHVIVRGVVTEMLPLNVSIFSKETTQCKGLKIIFKRKAI